MKKLLLIFIVTAGCVKFIVVTLLVFLISAAAILYGWSCYDAEEIRLRNKIFAQQEVAKIVYGMEDKKLFVAEQRKLIDYKAEYDILRQSWLGNLALGDRPDISIKIIINDKTRTVYRLSPFSE